MMGVKHVTDPHDAAMLIGFKDNIEVVFPCERGEWIQWLVAAVSNKNFMLLIDYDPERKIQGYLVAVNNVRPPLAASVSIIYVAHKNHGSIVAFREPLVSWAKKCGAGTIEWRWPADENKRRFDLPELQEWRAVKTSEIWHIPVE